MQIRTVIILAALAAAAWSGQRAIQRHKDHLYESERARLNALWHQDSVSGENVPAAWPKQTPLTPAEREELERLKLRAMQRGELFPP